MIRSDVLYARLRSAVTVLRWNGFKRLLALLLVAGTIGSWSVAGAQSGDWVATWGAGQAAPLPNTPAPGGTVLADTGVDASRAAEIALGLIAAGAAATVVGRKQADENEVDGEDIEN